MFEVKERGPSLQVLAVDEDEDVNGEVSYSIESDKWDGLFTIDSRTGIISAKAGLDRKEDYEFTVGYYKFCMGLCCGCFF